MQQKWYQKQRNIILTLIFFFPLGLVLMWKYTNWSKILKLVLTVGLLVVVPVSVAAKNAADKRANDAYNAAIGKEYWERKVADCKRKSTQNDITYSYGSWVNELDTAAITIHADLAEKAIPEVYVDGRLIDFNVEKKTHKPTSEPAYECKDTGNTYYSFSTKVPSTCTEKEVKLKTDKYELTRDVDNKNYGCKTKEQKDKEEAERKAKEESQKQAKAQEEADKKAKAASAEAAKQAAAGKVKAMADSVTVDNDLINSDNSDTFHYIFGIAMNSDEKKPYEVKVELLDTDGEVEETATYKFGHEKLGDGSVLYSKRVSLTSYSYPVGVRHGWIKSYRHSVTIEGKTFKYDAKPVTSNIQERF